VLKKVLNTYSNVNIKPAEVSEGSCKNKQREQPFSQMLTWLRFVLCR